MTLHEMIADKISNFLDNMYYKYLKKLYNDSISNIYNYPKFHIIKPEYFIYLQYYFVYTFFNYITFKNLILYSTSLHLTHISGLVYETLINKYNYKSKNNIIFLKDTNYLLFMYLFFFKILFLNKELYIKIFLLNSIYLFYFGYSINFIYKKRLDSIENNEELNHYLKILIVTPNKETIEKIIKNTCIFTYSNFLIFINILLFMVL
jgi:hypothetical protein